MTEPVVIAGYSGFTEVGRGGFATVYRARDERFRRDVAVKVLAGPLTEQSRARFFRECEAVGALSGHPNIVSVHDMGVPDAGGGAFLAMEYLPGGTLAARAGGVGMPWQEAVTVAVALAGALESAHRVGVLHRDVKPENVLFSAFDTAKLVDFGIATVGGGYETRSATVTASLAHAAPEVIAGRRASPASDVYSLASTLYFTLAGRAAFGSAHDETLMPLIARVSTAPVPDLRQIGVPDEVAAAVELGMAKQPGDRPASADAFAGELIAAAAASGVTVAPPVIADPASAITERTPVAAALAADEPVTAKEPVDPTQVVGRRRQPTAPAEEPEPRRRRVGLLIGAGVAALALITGGAYAVSVSNLGAGESVESTVRASPLPPASPTVTSTPPVSPSPSPTVSSTPTPSPSETPSPSPSPSKATTKAPAPKPPKTTPSAKPKPKLEKPGKPRSVVAISVKVTAHASKGQPSRATVSLSWSAPSGGGKPKRYCVKSNISTTKCTSSRSISVSVAALHTASGYAQWSVRAENASGKSGWVAAKARMPKIVGVKQPDATQKLRLAGIRTAFTTTPPPSSADEYVVYGQSPGAGTSMTAGKTGTIKFYS